LTWKGGQELGTYLNPGKTAFEEAVNSEIFVDKTGMILYLNSIVKNRAEVYRPIRSQEKSMLPGI